MNSSSWLVGALVGAPVLTYFGLETFSKKLDLDSGAALPKQEPSERGKPEWAYPSPYHKSISKDRFVDIQKLYKVEKLWDLPALVKVWKESKEEETWPWVWTWHNNNGPHYVFVGVNTETLRTCQNLAKASERNNITVVVRKLEDIPHKAKCLENDFYTARCAVIQGHPSQIDFNSKMLMLEDERIICFDQLTLA